MNASHIELNVHLIYEFSFVLAMPNYVCVPNYDLITTSIHLMASSTLLLTVELFEPNVAGSQSVVSTEIYTLGVTAPPPPLSAK